MKNAFSSLAIAAITLALSSVDTTAQQNCRPTVRIDGSTCIGDTFKICSSADPGCDICIFASHGPGPTTFPSIIGPVRFELQTPFFLLYKDIVGSTGAPICTTVTIPNAPGLIGTKLYYHGIAYPQGQFLKIEFGEYGVIEVCDNRPCILIIDEDTIDDGIKAIQSKASSHNITPSRLVNDDRPTKNGNPWLRWNTLHSGDVVLLPSGQVKDEGLFALPENTSFSVADFVAGTVPQSKLDKIMDVMPLRNQELAKLIGLTCVGVVYDSDISMNYKPINGNLQGERLGRFAFTVLDVVVAGSTPDSKSSTDLYDLLVRVEPPINGGIRYNVPVVDGDVDSIKITKAEWSNGLLTVRGESDHAPTATMTVSVDGFVLELAMKHKSGKTYEVVVPSATNLSGRRLCISTREGGAYNGKVN